ncbi:MAG: dienelactone hydrolase family protein [Acidobacteriota bacterium]|nr:dienelactone hydrolase family protein [Acidobacteriota bacterium]
MRRVISLFVGSLLLATAAFAATSQPVSYKSGGDTVQGLLFKPAQAKGKLPAIVVIHEWYGLNDWVKEQAGKLADQGYVTLAVDLYRGKVATTSDEAHELMRGLPDDRALRDLRAAVSYLTGRKDVDGKRIGAIGWCMGGGKAALLAANEPTLRAVAINYGSVPADEASLKNWNAATLGLFGGKDRGIPPESAQKFEATMKQLGKDVGVHIYPEAGHGFENPNNQAGYRADDAADAWKRITEFFAKKLKR